ncbi:MAG: hypothetical protein K2W97_03045 [Chthoniobacterales bacterium]|nr:hypothetical protein [Chthoniobacterales bacterium]
MIHENYGGDEAVLNRFDQLQPQKVSSYRFWTSRQANKDSQPSEVKYSHEDLRRFLDAPAQRVALDTMVQKTLRELSAHFKLKPTSNVDYKSAIKAANDMESFLNKGDLASAHRAALAFRGFARSAMNAAKYEAAVRGENPSSLSRSSTPDSMTTEESTVSAKGQEIELHPDYEYSQQQLSHLMDSSKKEIQKLQSYRMRPSAKEITAVKEMIEEGLEQFRFLSEPHFNNHKKITTQNQLQIASKISIVQNFLSIALKPSVTLSDLQSALDHLQEATNLYHQLPNK